MEKDPTSSQPSADPASETPKASGGSSLTRRGFLRNGSAAGVGIGLIVTSKTALGQTGTSDSDIRVGIIGCGAQAEALRAASTVVKGVKIGATADIQMKSAKSMAARLRASKQAFGTDGTGIHFYDDPQKMLDDPEVPLDAVYVATPDFVHHEWTRKAAEAGKHVYCEKLMSNTIARAADMVKAQEDTNQLIQIGHQRRSNPRYLHVRDKVVNKEKLLGWITHAYGQWNRSYSQSQPRPIPKKIKQYLAPEILQKHGYMDGDKTQIEGMFELINWRMYKKYGGGIISDLGAHQIDIFNWFFESQPKSVTATGGIDYYTEEFVTNILRNWVAEDEAAAAEANEDPTIQQEVRDQLKKINIGYEHADNVMLFYEYDTDRARWGTKAGTGDKLTSRAYYQVLTTTGSQKFYEKFMGEYGSIAISEDDKVNQIYSETNADLDRWKELSEMDNPIISKKFTKKEITHKFWEPEHTAPPVKHLAKITDSRVSKSAAEYQIPVSLTEPAHAPHVRNFIDTVRASGTVAERQANMLKCPVQEAFRSSVSILKIFESLETNQRVELKESDFDPKQYYGQEL